MRVHQVPATYRANTSMSTEEEAIVAQFGLNEEFTPRQRFEERCAVSRLVRNHDMVHVRGCRHTKALLDPLTPWTWPEDKTRAEVLEATMNGIKFCGTCRPLDGWEPQP